MIIITVRCKCVQNYSSRWEVGGKGGEGYQRTWIFVTRTLSSRATHCIQHVVSMWANTAINANTLHLLRLYTVFTLITLNRAQGASRRVSWTSPSPFTSNPFDHSHTLSRHVLFTHTFGLKHATFTLHQQYTHPVQPLPNLTQFLKSGKFWKKKILKCEPNSVLAGMKTQ